MDTVSEIKGAFSDPPHLCAPGLKPRLIPLPLKRSSSQASTAPVEQQETPEVGTSEVNLCTPQACEADRRRFAAGMEAVRFGLAVVAIVALGTLGGWAVMLVFKSLMQAQSLVVQNGFVLQR